MRLDLPNKIYYFAYYATKITKNLAAMLVYLSKEYILNPFVWVHHHACRDVR